MGWGSVLRPVAPEALPGEDDRRAQLRPKEVRGGDWSSEEAALGVWVGVAVFGGLLAVDGFLASTYLPAALSGSSDAYAGLALGLISIFFILPGIPLMAWGFTEAAWACFGAAAVGMVLGFFYVAAAPGILLALVVVGILLFALGMVMWLALLRGEAAEDRAPSV